MPSAIAFTPDRESVFGARPQASSEKTQPVILFVFDIEHHRVSAGGDAKSPSHRLAAGSEIQPLGPLSCLQYTSPSSARASTLAATKR